tara:strand:- start:758 stop:1003 length:246 start_codon:yes stop_codon:yes gene_type:complete
MELIKVRHQAFCESFCFCGLAEVDFTLAALNRAFSSLSAEDQEKLDGFLDGFQAFALSGFDQQKTDFFDQASAFEESPFFD